MSIRIDHALVLDPHPDGVRVLEDTRVHIDHGRIQELGGPAVEADHVLDGTGRLLVPGLVNAHTHLPMTLLRGYADELPLGRWLRERVWPMEARFSAETVRAGADLAMAELLASGVTGALDMYFFEDQVAEAARDAGVRCAAGFTVADAGTPEFGGDELIARADEFLRRWPADGSLVQGSIAPHAAYTCGEQTLAACAELSQRHGCLLQTHCSETRTSVYEVEAATGRRPLAQLDHAGCVGERSVLAHCGWITKDEVRRIGSRGAAVSHNPVSNQKLGTGGHTPLPELLDHDVPVALGTDGPASNNVLDPFQTMKAAALMHKHHRWDPAVVTAAQVLAMATRNGARLFGLEEGGRVAEGAPADVVVLEMDKPHLQPMLDPVSHVVYAARAGDVHATIVDGRLCYHDGEHRTLDWPSVRDRARAEVERLGLTGGP